MAAWAVAVKVIEEKSIVALGVLMETYIETLDSTNDPIASINTGCNPKTGNYWAIIVTT
jgi:hypothetical protein